MSTPRYGLVDAARTKAIILRQMERGYPLSTLAADAGVDKNVLRSVIDGRKLHVARSTARKVAAVPKLPTHVGTRRRIEALAVLGWPSTELSTRAYLNRYAVQVACKRDRFSVALRRQIADLYASIGPREIGPSQLCATVAKNAGYSSKLAWRNIDDPLEVPREPVSRSTKWTTEDAYALDREILVDRMLEGKYRWPRGAVRGLAAEACVEAVRRCLARGESSAAIGRKLKRAERTIDRVCAAHGLRAQDLPDLPEEESISA
jgi:hypothetical protein